MNLQDFPRPFFQETTASLRTLVDGNSSDLSMLSNVFFELLFRQRRAALELRELVVLRMLEAFPDYFPWPTTEAPGGSGTVDETVFQHEQGLLGFMGYRVGVSGLGAPQRQGLLDFVYSSDLPLVNSREYMDQWGRPRSTERLKKIAVSIATFARNSKRCATYRHAVAISEWEADLDYLRLTYYVGRYDFPWPITAT